MTNKKPSRLDFLEKVVKHLTDKELKYMLQRAIPYEQFMRKKHSRQQHKTDLEELNRITEELRKDKPDLFSVKQN